MIQKLTFSEVAMATKGRHMTCLSMHDWDSTLHSYKRDSKVKHDRQSFNKEYTDMYHTPSL